MRGAKRIIREGHEPRRLYTPSARGAWIYLMRLLDVPEPEEAAVAAGRRCKEARRRGRWANRVSRKNVVSLLTCQRLSCRFAASLGLLSLPTLADSLSSARPHLEYRRNVERLLILTKTDFFA
jgi:hypothetical protein